jgi:mRNA-degrading endonuclease RelE of RelBE toxin-antitoxin system
MEIDVYEVDIWDDFKKQYKLYFKKRKYRSLESQVKKLISDFKQGIFDSSTTPPLFHSDVPTPYDIYKMRMANPDAGEGKRSGYRIIYMVKTENKMIVLMTIYSKSDMDNIEDHEIQLLIDGYFMSQLPEED